MMLVRTFLRKLNLNDSPAEGRAAVEPETGVCAHSMRKPSGGKAHPGHGHITAASAVMTCAPHLVLLYHPLPQERGRKLPSCSVVVIEDLCLAAWELLPVG